ncbi:MAG TPA: DUF1186 domain-containing protein [Bradyrhizobium sp.]|jgi:hypothetical protein|nr:DUF1186 domain-containing protein [Bradyrhizobium sp.]
MRKEEAEAKLECGDLGPIEDHLEAVATEWRLPGYAIGMCLLRMEEAAPALRAVLARAADGEALSEDETTLLFRGIYILGGARDTEACQALLRLLRRPGDEHGHLLGNAVTEGMARIVAGVFDGDVDALFGLIVDRSVDQFVREQLLDAAAFLTWKEVIARDRMRGLLQRFYEERLADDEDEAWVGWLKAIALLGLRDMAPLVYRSLEEGRAPDWVINRRNFDEMLAEAEQRPDDATRFEEFRIGYIEDVVAALEWSDRPEPGEESDAFDEDPFDSGGLDTLWTSTEPVRNPWRHVGRNDPCPCGSGKKAKKCCLANNG